MQTFIVKSGKENEIIKTPHFFVLNKGLNSGKPLASPCPNCFKVEVESEDFKHVLYWISFALWKSKAFHPYLIGSVIPYIRIGDYKQVICEKLEVVKNHPDEFISIIEKLRFIEIKEDQLKENLRLVRDLKQAYVQSYFSKHG